MSVSCPRSYNHLSESGVKSRPVGHQSSCYSFHHNGLSSVMCIYYVKTLKWQFKKIVNMYFSSRKYVCTIHFPFLQIGPLTGWNHCWYCHFYWEFFSFWPEIGAESVDKYRWEGKKYLQFDSWSWPGIWSSVLSQQVTWSQYY